LHEPTNLNHGDKKIKLGGFLHNIELEIAPFKIYHFNIPLYI